MSNDDSSNLSKHERRELKRQQKRERKEQEASTRSQKKLMKNVGMYGGVFLIIVLLAFGGYKLATRAPSEGGGVSDLFALGPTGSTHEHGTILVTLHGEPVSFSSSRYQLRADYVHLESGDGETIHVHATGVRLKDFFKTLKWSLDDTCLDADDLGTYCTGPEGTLHVEWNGQEISGSEAAERKIVEGEDVLVTYGSE